MDIAYYPGCSLYQSAKLYNHQTRLVFAKLGLYLQEIDDWSCCGATSAGKINDFMAVALPARNLGIAEASGFSELVIPCSACYSRTLVARKQLEDFPLLKNEINMELSKKVNEGIKVSSILEVLLRELVSSKGTDVLTKRGNGYKPACYYGCMQTRFPYDVSISENVENPQGMEKVLETIGVQALDWNYKTLCCGASSVVYNTDCALELMGRIMGDAISRGANCLVVTCPMCQMNLASQQDNYCEKYGIKERLPVYFITELVGMAMGLTRKELQADDNLFIDGMDWTQLCGDSV